MRQAWAFAVEHATKRPLEGVSRITHSRRPPTTPLSHLLARVTMMPFCTLSSSVGRPCSTHSPTSESSTRNLVTWRGCERVGGWKGEWVGG